jgi:hypothetical protein
MESKWMLLPMLAQVLLTATIMQLARMRRLKAVKAGEVSGTYFKTMEGNPPPRYVLQSDQLVLNFFETPILFFAAGLAAMALNLVDPILVGLAWAFVLGRMWHAQVKLSHNKLGPRALAFTVTVVLITLMWLWLTAMAFVGG